MPKQFTLGKNERLKSRKQIEQLFNTGQRFVIPPFRIFYSLSANRQGNPDPDALQAGFGASSRNFKTAVARNRIKRLTREAYRLQKKNLQDKLGEENKKLSVFFIYTGKSLPAYPEIYASMTAVLTKLLTITTKRIENN